MFPNPSDPLLRAVAAHLARYKGLTRTHTESDLRIYLRWCLEHHLDPLQAERAHIELYVRWMQEVRGFKPSTISRRLSVATGFYRTCAIDGIIPAFTRRARPPAQRPARVTDLGPVTPAVRGHARCREGLYERQ